MKARPWFNSREMLAVEDVVPKVQTDQKRPEDASLGEGQVLGDGEQRRDGKRGEQGRSIQQ